ncbi:MAG: cytochrome c [marine bacterium B5-7]|nr:MAG: cytochrome c [marine bacterium B5-7]
MSEIIIYKTEDGHIELNVSLSEETVWLSLNQIAALFGRDKSVISKHLSNIFKNNELDKHSVVANFATTAADGKTYQVDYYHLDAIISIGYRVNSLQATQFRIWATQVLKDHLVQGYTLYEKRLAERGVNELQQSMALLQKTLTRNDLVNDIGVETIQLIMSYAKTWHLLLAYDEDELTLPALGKPAVTALHYETAIRAIETLKSDLAARHEATALFGNEREHGLQGILGNIEQTFGGEALYKTIEERAAHLLYFMIKDHPFSDGNKRIGCLMFLLYLKLQNTHIKFNDNGLVALALLIAESDPQQKTLMVRLIVNLLTD